jgi:putative heme-binding domain-containing protein
MSRAGSIRLFALLCSAAVVLHAQTPEWIWGAKPQDGEKRSFLKEFLVPAGIERAVLTVAADNRAQVLLDGKPIGSNESWSQPTRLRIPSLPAGSHRLEIEAGNEDGAAGLLVRLELHAAGSRSLVVSDSSWQTRSLPTSAWVPAVSIGQLGVQPWGEVSLDAEATSAASLRVPSGFRVELLHSSEAGQGSWVSMTVDDRGRLIVGPQGSEPLLRFTLDDAGKVVRTDPIGVPLRGAMGLLWSQGVLYANAAGSQGYALHRIRDTDGDDRFDSVELLRKWEGDAGEHGPHGIVKGPDGRLYVVNGNFVELPADLSPASPVRNYADDLALPRMEDGNGFGAGRKPPGGYVVSLDADGKDARLFAAGERNTYDIAFNGDGELFGFDSDMEWDWGTPWYRPTRVHHIVSGADHGFREGSAKWPVEHADSLPPVVEIGIGSPTGVRFGTGARFPERFRKALFAMDWSYGRILAVHLVPDGAGYTGTAEDFVVGRPLNVADLEVGRDGAMYFITGGRGTQSGLYRVTWTGPEPVPEADAGPAEAVAARAIRRRIEQAHGRVDSATVDANWTLLGSPDRTLRHAMRLALESQPMAVWKDRALAETNAAVGLHALLALVRMGGATESTAALKTLTRWPLDQLDETLFLAKLRVITVAFSRHGIPEAMRPLAVEKLGRQLPAPSWPKNRELVPLLVALGDPAVVSKALDLRDAAGTQEEQLHYMAALRLARDGWTPALRERYFGWFRGRSRITAHPAKTERWFADVGLKASNGASFDNFVKNLRREAFEAVPPDQKGPIAAFLASNARRVATIPASVPRNFVRDWKASDLGVELSQPLRGRDFSRGKSVYQAAQCAACHRFQGEGGAVGPDLTGIGTRYAKADVWVSLTEPSRIVSEQYQARTFVLKDGTEFTGRVVARNEARVTLVLDPLTDRRTEVAVGDIRSESASPISTMPEGLLSTFSREEILDLIAYLESDGRPEAPAFAKP